MAKKRINVQVADKGFWFSFLFYVFFMMSVIPIFLVIIASLMTNHYSSMLIPIVFATILFFDFKSKNLFRLCRNLTVLNLTLWFLFGFFSLLQQIAQELPSFLTYIILVPYAIISSFMVFYLLSRADRDPKKVIKGGIAVSTMIALISAVNGAIISALKTMTEQAEQIIQSNSTTMLVEKVTPSFHNPHLAFLLVFILFNIPFVRYYWKMSKKRNLLWYYIIPVILYVLLTGLWIVFKEAVMKAFV
jgi:hypothetical protein